MKYVLIDTCIYKKEEFNFSSGFLNLINKLRKNNKIMLIESDIIIKEVENLLLENRDDFYSSYKNSKRAISCLNKNSEFSFFFKLDKEIIGEKMIEESRMFFSSCKNKKLKLSEVSIQEIVNDYFAQKPPFGSSDKKYEFPDALILNSLIKENFNDDDEVFVVSKDKDWEKYFSKINKYNFFDNLYELIKSICTEKEQMELYQQNVEKWCDNNSEIILHDLNEELSSNFDFHVINDEDEIINNDSWIKDFNDVNCVYMSKEEGIITFEVSFDTNVDFVLEYLDYDNAIFDREDNEYYNLDRKVCGYCGKIKGIAGISLNAKFLDDGRVLIESINGIDFFQHEIDKNIDSLEIVDVYNDEYDYINYDF